MAATLIIHNAWRLDFNLVLASFTPQLDSVSTLVHLSLRSPHPSPPRILFTSSIATVSNWPLSTDPVPERPLDDLNVAVGNGYGESKAVAERILEVATERTPLKSTNFRIGQLAGSTSRCLGDERLGTVDRQGWSGSGRFTRRSWGHYVATG
ncbi:hypothetical protein FRB94_006730 [Tulasnella sp. JGI-2019a]|nr:hypothetical protein FRB93_002054 [Tulasnella sp. JGI-2019a]KAG8998639.1 hypothetical protein FRB94_006730 [Tulasnella sp. JGI-2019a]